MVKEPHVMFKMLFRPEMYTLEEVREMISKNKDVAWVVYQTIPGTHKGERANLGTMNATAIMAKFG